MSVEAQQDDSTHPHHVLLHIMPIDSASKARRGWYLRPGEFKLTRVANIPVTPKDSPDA